MAETTQTPAPAKTEPSTTGKVAEKIKDNVKAKPARRHQPKQLPPYNVVLLDDNDHSYEYVIEMLRALFGYPDLDGFRLAKEVDESGRVIVLTTHKEKAELKRDQITAFGADRRIPRCKGSMTAVIEPAEE